MTIEARGGKFAYAYVLVATRQTGSRINVETSLIFDTADSEDEAFGRGMKIARLVYPPDRDWKNHFVTTKEISWIGWIDRYDMDGIKPLM